jgi:hypothetical protein
LFFTGLVETEEPYAFLAQQGLKDLLQRGGSKILPAIPQIVLPIKCILFLLMIDGLNTRNPKVVTTVLKSLQDLVDASPQVGEALVPYYRQILPIFNLFKNRNRKTFPLIFS